MGNQDRWVLGLLGELGNCNSSPLPLLLSPPPLGATKMAYPSIPAIMYDRDRPFRLAPSLDRPTPLPEENVEFMIQEAIETGKEGEEMDCL